ncbi:MAG: winged helix-turn-helix domain-containing protein [Caldimicrobium sp.]|jgi:molybdate transport system regulatory protein
MQKKKKFQKDPEHFYIVESSEKDGFKLKGKIWIEGKEGTFLGIGRAQLLEKIKECKSISKAAKTLNMSYKKAWDLIDSMNKQAKNPLVITKVGGAGGGRTELTEEGEKILNQFKELYEEFKKFLEKEINKF